MSAARLWNDRRGKSILLKEIACFLPMDFYMGSFLFLIGR